MENDEIEESVETNLRNMMMAAGAVGTQLARFRQQRAERQGDRDSHTAVVWQQRYEAEQAAVRAELQQVHDPGWWDQASAEQIAHAHMAGRAWAGHNPDIDRANTVLGQQVKRRWDIDVGRLDRPVDLKHAVRVARGWNDDARQHRAVRDEHRADLADLGVDDFADTADPADVGDVDDDLALGDGDSGDAQATPTGTDEVDRLRNQEALREQAARQLNTRSDALVARTKAQAAVTFGANPKARRSASRRAAAKAANRRQQRRPSRHMHERGLGR